MRKSEQSNGGEATGTGEVICGQHGVDISDRPMAASMIIVIEIAVTRHMRRRFNAEPVIDLPMSEVTAGISEIIDNLANSECAVNSVKVIGMLEAK